MFKRFVVTIAMASIALAPLSALAQRKWIDSRASVSVSRRFPVFVNYRAPLEKMVAAAGYDDYDGLVTRERFPYRGEEPRIVNCLMVYYRAAVSIGEIYRDLEQRGLRAAGVEELLFFAAAHPDLRKSYKLVALGSEWLPPDGNINDALVPWVGVTMEPESFRFLGIVNERFLYTDEIDGPIVVLAVEEPKLK
jgi:hypothetical protein